MYVPSEELLFCLQLERLSVIASASPPVDTSHGSSPPAPLPLDCSTLLFSSLTCSYSSFASWYIQFQTITPLHPRLSFIPPLRSLLGSGYLEALGSAGIKSIQRHLQFQNKNRTAGFCSPQ